MTDAQALHPSAGIHTLTHVQTKSVTVSNSSTEAKPERLIIPAIDVNTSLEAVEILADGNLATPTRSPWDNVGWYDLGTNPGDRGSAVIDGHLDRPGGSPAVFWNLRNLRVGNDVLLLNAQAKTLHFRVRQVAFYTPQAAPLQDIFGNTGGNYLNLITCAGDWIPSQHQTTLRLVVYTTLVN
ncbi:MAG: class F sortase [Ktedonobacteraceae bacterium]